MKVLGGGQHLALRAEPEWDSLVERLRLHGLEPTARAFAMESSKRDVNVIPTHGDGQSAHDTASNSQDEARRFSQQQQQQQQQQHQQKQPRHRNPAGSSRRLTVFSPDSETSGHQLT
jgi:hypothetical protein